MEHPTASEHPSASRHRLDATVEFNRLICREHYLLRLRVAGAMPPTRPGQFVQLGCRPPNGHVDLEALQGDEFTVPCDMPPRLRQPELCQPLALLRRPFSLAGRGDDERGTWIEIIHRVVGVGTHWLSQLQPGDPVDMIGPLGNAFALPPNKSIGLLVGGGVGLPPMFYLAEALHQAGWQAVGFVGALSRDLLAVTFDEGVAVPRDGTPAMSVREFARFGIPAVITTDDGSLGLPGRITAGLEQILAAQSEADRRRTVVYTCGPEPMMHAAAALARRFGVDCQVCLEQAMACGMGTCQSCVVRIAAPDEPWRFQLACTQGPVFAADAVVWDS